MRTINPTAIATIRRLIDCLIIDPENFFKFFRVRVLDMALPPRMAKRPAAGYVANWLQSFREFPPRQKPGSFNLDRVMEAVTAPPKSSN
jgi:hypothetical protein